MTPPADSPSAPAALGDPLIELLGAMSEPAALVSASGEIHLANTAFRRRVGGVANLSELSGERSDDLHRYLSRCASLREPLLGVLELPDGEKLRARGSLARIGERKTIFLRLFEADHRFARLSNTVKELNALLRQREHEKARLEEALRDRDIMHRELQHRVKNNVQMLAGLLYASRTEAPNEEARAALDEAARRLGAVAAAHQSLYQLGDLGTVPAAPLITQIVEAAVHSAHREVEHVLNLADIRLSNDSATPLALIANELVTNALKHARTNGSRLELAVTMAQSGGEVVFTVADNGTGFHAPSALRRSSGLGLVRGLLRQIRGKLDVEQVPGTRFILRFPSHGASR